MTRVSEESKKSKKFEITNKCPIEKTKIQVVFTKEQREIIRSLKGDLGNTEAEIIRNIVLQNEIIRDKIKRKHEDILFTKHN